MEQTLRQRYMENVKNDIDKKTGVQNIQRAKRGKG